MGNALHDTPENRGMKACIGMNVSRVMRQKLMPDGAIRVRPI